MAQRQRTVEEMIAAVTGGGSISAAEIAQINADAELEKASQVPSPPFQAPPYDLRIFPKLNLFRPNVLSDYFNNQFSLNEKMARHKLSQSGVTSFDDGPDMAARETWSILSKAYEEGKRMAILTDSKDQQLILILFTGEPIRLPVQSDDNESEDHPQVALPICWACSNRSDPNLKFFIEMFGYCCKSFGIGANLTSPPNGGAPGKTICDLEEQKYLLATLSRHGRKLTEEYKKNHVEETEDQVCELQNVKISHAMGELYNAGAIKSTESTAKEKKKQKKAMEKRRKMFMKNKTGQATKVRAMCTGEIRGDPCFKASYITQIYAGDEIKRTNKKTKKNLKSTCAYCAKTAKELGDGVKLKCCSRCHNQWYCSTICQKLAWKQGHKKECLSDNKSNTETWIDVDLTNGFQPVIEAGGFLYLRSNSITGHGKAAKSIKMGMPEYKEAIKFMLKKYKGKKQFVVKVQTGPTRQHACQIYDKDRKMLCYARSDISGSENFNALCDAVEKTKMKRKGYFYAVIKRDQANKDMVRIRIDKELSSQNLHW